MLGKSRVLAETDVRVSGSPVRVGRALPAAEDGEESRQADTDVSVKRDAAGNVVEIHVTCSCGELTVIACEYSTAS